MMISNGEVLTSECWNFKAEPANTIVGGKGIGQLPGRQGQGKGHQGQYVLDGVRHGSAGFTPIPLKGLFGSVDRSISLHHL